MSTFRKKPVEIQAVLWTGSNQAEIEAFVTTEDLGQTGSRLEIYTLEGTMIASPGDYIIRGVQGEFYPCKPDIFAATYDEVSV